MLRPGGYAVAFEPYGGMHEADTYTCGHCNRVTHVKPRQRPEDIGGRCSCCNCLMCLECTAKQTCDPLEEKLRRMERR